MLGKTSKSSRTGEGKSSARNCSWETKRAFLLMGREEAAWGAAEPGAVRVVPTHLMEGPAPPSPSWSSVCHCLWCQVYRIPQGSLEGWRWPETRPPQRCLLVPSRSWSRACVHPEMKQTLWSLQTQRLRPSDRSIAGHCQGSGPLLAPPPYHRRLCEEALASPGPLTGDSRTGFRLRGNGPTIFSGTGSLMAWITRKSFIAAELEHKKLEL